MSSSAPFLSRAARRFRRGWLLPLLLVAATAWGYTDRTFTTPTVLKAEASTLVKLLDQVHYNHANVSPDNYAEVIPDYMAALDGQHLFFLASDKRQFTDRYADGLYYNLYSLGDVSPAYDIFNTYNRRVEDRVNWIFAALKKPIDLAGNGTYAPDRTKAGWPATPADADALWQKRLTFEIIQEMLNKKTLPEAEAAVRKRYERMLKNIADLDGSDLSELYLDTVARLYDPHSDYFSADTYADFAIQMRLSLVGIGAVLASEDDYCVIKEIVPGGPADLSRQLHPNDKIIAVATPGSEPVDIIGMKLRKIVDMIRGHKGTQVTLTVIPGDATDSSLRRQVVLTRDVVKLNASRARAAVFQVPDGKNGPMPVGVIYLPAFYGPNSDTEISTDQPSASHDVAALIGDLKRAGIKGLVLDLRGNGGGLLNEAVDLTGLFIGHGPVVQVRSYDGTIRSDDDEDPGIAYTGPLAVLVSRFSASASEIVTGALQNYGRAVVIGDRSTHGKGTVQTVVELQNLISGFPDKKMGAIKITVQKFYLPDGASTQLKGVTPDIVIPSIDDYLPIGETSLPHALPWDTIPGAHFAGGPLNAKLIATLRDDSLTRQATLPEFAYLRESIAWFRARQEQQKAVPLNLDVREHVKAIDDQFRKQMEQRQKEFAKGNFPYKEFTLDPAATARARAEAKKAAAVAAKDAAANSDDDAFDPDATDDDFGQFDIDLRESLRVVRDAINLGRDHALWDGDHAPLTAEVAAAAAATKS